MICDQIDKKSLQQAIKVLRELNTKFYEDSSKKKPLLEDEKESTLYLQFSLKKIPKCKSIKMIKINLPHSLVKDDSEICLIAGDLDKRNHKAEIEPDILHYKELLKKHDINNISEVVTLRQLRTEYKPYEAKQKLLAAYDVFLADRKITECLPKVLGRHFFKKRKFPIQITLNTPNLKQQVEKALSTKVFYLTGLGNSCNSEVAYLDMTDTEISENIVAMTKAFCDVLPGSWDNLMGIYLKTSRSKSIPLYMSYDDPSKISLQDEKDNNSSFEIDELSTEPNKLVKVYRDGRIHTIRIKRMPENEACETVDVNKKKKKSSDFSDDIHNSVNTHLNEESKKVKKKLKSEKKEKNKLEQETEIDACNIDGKGETVDVTVDVNKKKKKSSDFSDDIHNSVNTHLNEESTKVKKKLKSEKKEKNKLEQGTEIDACSIDGKGETVDVTVDVNKKKKKSSDFSDDIHNSVNTHLNEESKKIKKKLKSEKKEKNKLEQGTKIDACSIDGKEKSMKDKKKLKSEKKVKSNLEQGTEIGICNLGGKGNKRRRNLIETIA